jgi:membrane-bound lytic murein transglycosylase B
MESIQRVLHFPQTTARIAMRSRRLLTCFACAAALAACAQPVKPSAPAQVVPQRVPVTTPAGIASVAAPVVASTTAAEAPPLLAADKRAAFVAQTAQAYGLDAKDIEAGLAQASYKQSIINAITRPAESKPWKDYRPIFMTEARIQGGRRFLAEHREELAKVQAATGVPAEMIVAIIGVETQYGGNTGSYRVLDALYTLGFFYPKREEFFRGELGHFFALAKQEKLDPSVVKGSYAGAMGWGQFMPSSYRNYGKDGDGDGRRDLFGSPRDIFASIANYFVGHGWRSGEPVFLPAQADSGAAAWVPENYEAKYSLAEIALKGFRPLDAAAPKLPATLLTLEGATGTEYWIGYQNFYVLTRYNRSPLYAMAVFQLSREIAAGEAATP